MNFADQLVALSRNNQDMLPNQYRDYYHKSNVSMDSSSLSDDDSRDNVFSDKTKNTNWDSSDSSGQRLNKELATILAANRLLSVDERSTSRPKKKNVYVQQRCKHSSGGSGGGSGTKKTAWKRIAEKFGKPQHHKNENKQSKNNSDSDSWRRFSLDAASVRQGSENGGEVQYSHPVPPPIKHADLKRLLSLDREDGSQKEYQPMRPRSNSEVSHFKILSKNAETADFTVTVTASSRLADASALCYEYFSRLTCYEAVPHQTSVIAVDKRIPISRAFNIFCENNATAVMLWDSTISSVVSTCHVDDLVCRLWNKARKSGIGDQLFDVEGDFSQPLSEFCAIPYVKSVAAEMNLMDAARCICSLKDANNRSSNRLALANDATNDIVHLFSAWDVLGFFSQQVSKFHVAHTAFDHTLSSILDHQSESQRQIEVWPETKQLKEVIGSLAANGGGAVVCRFEPVKGKQIVTTLSFLDIIQYVIRSHGSWYEADATKKTLGHVLRHHKQKESLVFTSNTPLFAVLQEWIPSMTADMPVVVVDDAATQNVVGVLEPEHLLQALLLEDVSPSPNADDAGMELNFPAPNVPVTTRL